MEKRYVVVTDWIKPDGKRDVADELQKLIDENPNRVIFFPDGEYRISKPLRTPAAHDKSVSLQLSDFAVIKADEGWKSNEAMVCLGGKNPENDISAVGSNYGIQGGVLDGSGIAVAISIDSGRETTIRGISIKNVPLGVHIRYGVNAGSSDADISDVNIVGTGKPDSLGVLVEGYDNTFTNMRITNVFTGVRVCSGGNMFRNIHPLFISREYYAEYQKSIGFYNECGSNWFDHCYSDQFANAFYTKKGVSGIYQNCFCFWYSAKGEMHTAFKAEETFDSIVSNMNIRFKNPEISNVVLCTKEKDGKGIFENLIVNRDLVTDEEFMKYLKGTIISV